MHAPLQLVIIPYILMAYMFDNALLFQRPIRSCHCLKDWEFETVIEGVRQS